MDFLELAAKRQTCRSFADKPVEHEKLEKIVEAGRLAPSACNSQPWSFWVAENPEAVEAVAAAAQQLGANAYVAGARAFVVVAEEFALLKPVLRSIVQSQYFAQWDLGQATAYLCLEAETQGLGTCQISIFDREKIAAALGMPPEQQIASLIAVGYPADGAVRAKDRKPLADVARFV